MGRYSGPVDNAPGNFSNDVHKVRSAGPKPSHPPPDCLAPRPRKAAGAYAGRTTTAALAAPVLIPIAGVEFVITGRPRQLSVTESVVLPPDPGEQPIPKNPAPPACPKCRKQMRFMLVKTGGRKFRCIDCDLTDPLKIPDGTVLRRRIAGPRISPAHISARKKPPLFAPAAASTRVRTVRRSKRP